MPDVVCGVSAGCLGNIKGRTVCDVGSRLGPVLWGGYHLSEAAKLVGVEMNSWFCDLQRKVVAKHGMSDRKHPPPRPLQLRPLHLLCKRR